MRDFFRGLGTYADAWRLVWKTGMWPLLAAPGFVGLIYFPLIIVLTAKYAASAARNIRDHWLPDFLNNTTILGLLTVTVWIVALYGGFLLFRNMVMILYAPVLGYLSETTEGNAFPEGPGKVPSRGFINAAVRGLTMSFASLAFAVAAFILCCVLLLIPVIGQLGMILLLPVVQMFLAGHGFIDPALERRGFTIRMSFQFVWRNRFRALGGGAGFLALSLIPIAGWFLAPTLGIVAGTLNALSLLEERNNNRESLEPLPAT